MDKKTLSIISYITIIGWAIAYFSYNNSANKDSLTRFHLKQSLGIAILGILLSVALTIISMVVPTLASILSLANFGIIILWVLGMVTSYTLSGFIHVLLVLAVIMILVRLINGEKPINF